MLTALLVGLGVLAGLPLGMLTEMLLPLASVATLTAFVFSLLLYLKALMAPASALAPGGNSGERGFPWGTDGGREGCLLATSLSAVLQAIPSTTFSWDGNSTRASVPLTANISANCGLASSAGYAGHGSVGLAPAGGVGRASSSWAGQLQYCPDIIHSSHKYLLNLVCVLRTALGTGI